MRRSFGNGVVCKCPSGMCKCNFGDKMTKAQEMAQLTTKAIREKEQKDKELVADFYQETLRLIEREAVKGNRLADISIPRNLNVDTIINCLLEDGFGVINDSTFEIEISW